MKRPALELIKPRNFWAKVAVLGPDDCWEWQAAVSTGGYGTFTVGDRTFCATHVSLTLDERPRPDAPNHFALHGDCCNPKCVNPRHLRWGTQRENIADVHRLGRAVDNRGERQGRSKLTAAVVRAMRTSGLDAKTLAADYGVSYSNVCHILRGSTWVGV